MINIRTKNKDPEEYVKQQQKALVKVLHSKLEPHENHIVFQYDYVSKILSLATIEPESKDIHWNQAVLKNFSKKRVVIRQKDCIYLSALNFENAKKQLRRDHQVEIEEITISKTSMQ